MHAVLACAARGAPLQIRLNGPKGASGIGGAHICCAAGAGAAGADAVAGLDLDEMLRAPSLAFVLKRRFFDAVES